MRKIAVMPIVKAMAAMVMLVGSMMVIGWCPFLGVDNAQGCAYNRGMATSDFVSAKDASVLAGVSSSMVRRWIRAGKVEGRLVSAPSPYWEVSCLSLDVFLAARKEKPRSKDRG